MTPGLLIILFLHQFSLTTQKAVPKETRRGMLQGHATGARLSLGMSTARLVRLAPRQKTDGHGHNADADEKDDHGGHGRLPLVAAFLGRNHNQGKRNGKQRPKNVEAGHGGKIKIHSDDWLASRMLRYQKMRESNSPAHTRKILNTLLIRGLMKTEARKIWAVSLLISDSTFKVVGVMGSMAFIAPA